MDEEDGKAMITEQTKLIEIYEMEAIRQAREYLIGNGTRLILENKNDTLAEFQEKNPTWYAKDLAYGLNRLTAVASEEPEYFFSVYNREEIDREPEKEDVKLFYFPAKGERRNNRFVILLAGGGYQAVCSMVEAMPVAAKLNDMGITAFCLNYRAGQRGLLPKPLEDLAAAYRFLAAHKARFWIEPEHYAVGGFSAGGHAAACWGTKCVGFHQYGLPAPELLMLDYPAITMENRHKSLSPEMWENFLDTMVGDDRSQENCEKYCVNRQVDGSYPPVYLVQARDDNTVPVQDSDYLIEALEEHQVPWRAERPATGGHGFGLGSATPAAGWVERAVRFWEEQACREKEKQCRELLFHREVMKGIYLISRADSGPTGEGTSMAPGNPTGNSYLVVGQERALLFDLAVDAPGVGAYAEQLAGKPVQLVISHAHCDHIYHLEEFQEMWMHPADEPLLREGIPGIAPPPVSCPKLHYLREGDVVDLGGRKLTVLHVPGHTPGSILLLDSETRTLLSGDTCARRLLYGISGFVPLADFLNSLSRIQALDFDVIYSAHDRCGLPKAHLQYMREGILQELPRTERTWELPGVGEFLLMVQGDVNTLRYFDMAIPKKEVHLWRQN